MKNVWVFAFMLIVYAVIANAASERSGQWVRPMGLSNASCSYGCNISYINDTYVNVAGDVMTGSLLVYNWIGTNMSLIYDNDYSDYSMFTRDGGHDGGVVYTDAGAGLKSDFGFRASYYWDWTQDSSMYIDTDRVYFAMFDGSYPFSYESGDYTHLGTSTSFIELQGTQIFALANISMTSVGLPNEDLRIGFEGATQNGNITYDVNKDIFLISDKTNITGNVTVASLFMANNNSMFKMKFGKPSGTSEYDFIIQKYSGANPAPTIKSNTFLYFMPSNTLAIYMTSNGLSYIDGKGMILGSGGVSKAPNIYGSSGVTNGTAARYTQNLYIGVSASDYSPGTYIKSYTAMIGPASMGTSTTMGNTCNWKIQARKYPTLMMMPQNCTSSGNRYGAISFWNNQSFMIETPSNYLILNGSKGTNVSNELNLRVNGRFTMLGNATVWDDLLALQYARTLGSKDPSMDLWNGTIYTWAFDDDAAGSEEELFFTIQTPHDMKIGSSLYPHVHWSPDTSTAQNVTWVFTYQWANINENYGNTISTLRKSCNTIAVKHRHNMCSFPAMAKTNSTLSSVIVGRLYRDSANATDTSTVKAWLLGFDLHYEKDKLGSANEASN